MIDISKYEKIGEYRDGVMTWLSSDITNVVYLIMFGNESYVGSTKSIRIRFASYIPSFQNGRYHAMKVQKAFDKSKCFEVYAVEITSNDILREREAFYVNTLKPTLNTRTFAKYGEKIKKSKESAGKETKKCKDANFKGIYSRIPMSIYMRLITQKINRNKTISDLFEEAICLWLDVQEGKRQSFVINKPSYI